MNELEYGRRIGPYEIVEVLGRGGMAVVYKARQESLDRFVALKVLAPELARDHEFIVRFQQEAATAARLEHANIVPIYDVGEADGLPYIAMRYVGGGTLGDLLARSGPLPLPAALDLLKQIADALDHAHAHGVVHRDLKPGNILLEPSGDRASLTDFGIARAGEGSRFTRLGQVAGTPEYMSPEQAQGQPVDARTDLYALGVVAYEMLTGRVPFEADSGVAILHQQVYCPPPPLRALRPDVPSAVQVAVEQMLAKNPAERFPSGAGFMAALRGLASPRRRSGPDTLVSRPESRPRRVSGMLLPVGAAAGALALVAAALVFPRPPAGETSATPVAAPPAPTETQAALPTVLAPTAIPTQPPRPTTPPTFTPVPSPTLAPTATPVPPPPAIAKNDLSPKTVLPGDRVSLTYEITHTGDAPLRAVLGASILPSGGGAPIDDPSNDEIVTLQPGRGVYQRVFRVPVDAAPGRYDVWWGLFGTDRQHFDLKKVQGVLVVSAPTPPALPTFAPVPAPTPSSPAGVVRQYYLLIGNRSFAAAWDLLSPQQQRSLDYTRWVSGFNTTRSVDVPSTSVVSQSGSAATVSVTVRSVDADASGRLIPKTWQGTWDLVFTGGAWKLQVSNIKQVS